MVGEQQAGDLVRGVHVGRATRKRHLDGGGAPRDERRQLALADALQRLVHLRRVHLALETSRIIYNQLQAYKLEATQLV